MYLQTGSAFVELEGSKQLKCASSLAYSSYSLYCTVDNLRTPLGLGLTRPASFTCTALNSYVYRCSWPACYENTTSNIWRPVPENLAEYTNKTCEAHQRSSCKEMSLEPASVHLSTVRRA